MKSTKNHDDAQLTLRAWQYGSVDRLAHKNIQINLKYEKNSGYQMKSSFNGVNVRWRHSHTKTLQRGFYGLSI